MTENLECATEVPDFFVSFMSEFPLEKFMINSCFIAARIPNMNYFRSGHALVICWFKYIDSILSEGYRLIATPASIDESTILYIYGSQTQNTLLKRGAYLY